MKFRTIVRRSTVVIVILAAAVLIGYAYQLIGDRLDLKRHPRLYSEIVERYAAEYGVPEYVLYGVIARESGFQSNKVSEDGRVGLMQIGADTYARVAPSLKETAEAGILYDPATNVRCGAYCLARLYAEYGRWRPAFVAYETSPEQAEEWAGDPNLLDEYGNLYKTPYDAINDKIDAIEASVEQYRALYYGGQDK